ncbi:hypothetical protein G6514_009731 [Epicoccum nigrum]|nr:hypothetical protein G6514_009731 [Epicoccum nigrum]
MASWESKRVLNSHTEAPPPGSFMPCQNAFEVSKANNYIHTSSEWDPEDQQPPQFTGKFPLPDPRTHTSFPKLFIFNGQHNSRLESVATHPHNNFTSNDTAPGGAHGISIRGVSGGFSGGFNPRSYDYSTQDGNFGSHNPGLSGYGGEFDFGPGGGNFSGHNHGPASYGGGFNLGSGGYTSGPGGYGASSHSGPGGYSAQGGSFGAYFGGFHPGSGGHDGGYGGDYRHGACKSSHRTKAESVRRSLHTDEQNFGYPVIEGQPWR